VSSPTGARQGDRPQAGQQLVDAGVEGVDLGSALAAPGQEIRTLLDSFPARTEQQLEEVYRVTISYEGERGRGYVDEMVLDLGVYAKVTYVEQRTVHDLHRQVKRIADELRRWAASGSGLKVVSRKDQRADRAAAYRHFRTRPGNSLAPREASEGTVQWCVSAGDRFTKDRWVRTSWSSADTSAKTLAARSRRCCRSMSSSRRRRRCSMRSWLLLCTRQPPPHRRSPRPLPQRTPRAMPSRLPKLPRELTHGRGSKHATAARAVPTLASYAFDRGRSTEDRQLSGVAVRRTSGPMRTTSSSWKRLASAMLDAHAV
jgi:hypothetical protein